MQLTADVEDGMIRSKGTVLVVDDDALVREALAASRSFLSQHRPWRPEAPFGASDLRALIDAQWRALD